MYTVIIVQNVTRAATIIQLKFTDIDGSTLAAWLTVIVTLLGVITALFAVWWQMRKQWIMNSASMIMALTERFSSNEWRSYRIHCAAVIEAHRQGEAIDLSRDFPVLGFFENMAHLVRRGILDKEMVWNKFGWYVTRYYLALTAKGNLIEHNRRSEGDKTLWEEFEWLNREMLRFYKRRGIRVNEPELVMSRINELLAQESHLNDFISPPSLPKIFVSTR